MSEFLSVLFPDTTSYVNLILFPNVYEGKFILLPSTPLYLSSFIFMITPKPLDGLVPTTLLKMLFVRIPKTSYLPKLMTSSPSTTLPLGPLMAFLHSFSGNVPLESFSWTSSYVSYHFSLYSFLTAFLTSATTKILQSISFWFTHFIPPDEFISPIIYELMFQNLYLQPQKSLNNYKPQRALASHNQNRNHYLLHQFPPSLLFHTISQPSMLKHLNHYWPFFLPNTHPISYFNLFISPNYHWKFLCSYLYPLYLLCEIAFWLTCLPSCLLIPSLHEVF